MYFGYLFWLLDQDRGRSVKNRGRSLSVLFFRFVSTPRVAQDQVVNAGADIPVSVAGSIVADNSTEAGSKPWEVDAGALGLSGVDGHNGQRADEGEEDMV